MELRGIPENQLLAEAAQVHHANRSGRKIIEDEIAVAHAVQTVLRDGGEIEQFRDALAVKRIRRRGERTGAERHDVCGIKCVLKPLAVAQEHLNICHHIVRERDRLRSLQMRIAGHNRIQVGLCKIQQCFNQLVEQGAGFFACFTRVHARIKHALVIAAASGMQTLARLANPFGENGFNIHMNVFRLGGPLNLARLRVSKNAFKSLDDFRRVLLRNDVLLAEHGGMGD